MARLFTLNFHFREKPYSALVTIRDNGYDMVCIVKYMDEELHQVIPSGKFVFQLSGEVNCGIGSNPDLEELIACTSQAIAEHLKMETTV
jgi:hypothetical protein